MNKSLKTLVIDVSHRINPLTGIGYYAENTLTSMKPLLPDTEIYSFDGQQWQRLSSIGPDDHKCPKLLTRLAGSASCMPGTRKLWGYWKYVRYTAGMRKIRPEIIYAPNYLPPRLEGLIVPVVHDLSHIRNPGFHPRGTMRRLKKLEQVIDQAPVILTVSRFSKSEIIDIFGVAPDKVFIASPGVSSTYRAIGREQSSPVLAKYDLATDGYFLSVGTLEPRKNLRTLIRAYRKLPSGLRDRIPLVIIGGKGWGDPGLPPRDDPLFAAGQLRLLGYVPLSDMPALYSGAAAFVYPSVYEGFGMPVVEALACGTQVIASIAASVPEAAGSFSDLLDPLDVDAWYRALREAIEMIGEDNHLRKEAGLQHAARFTWKRTAECTIEGFYHARN